MQTSAHPLKPRHLKQQRQSFWTVYRCLERRAELNNLIAWATRKHLTGPRRCYQSRLSDEERRLFRYHLHSPRTLRWAQLLFAVKTLCLPPKRHHKGAAAAYRYRPS